MVGVAAGGIVAVGRGPAAPAAVALPRGDLPLRIVVATALVLAITELAPALGPRLSGILATFPVYAAVLAVFAHRTGAGAAAAAQVLGGLLFGLFAFAAFFVVLGTLLERAGVALAFAAATAVALAVQAASFALMRARRASL